MANVMIIGAHPDDAELGTAGTILKHLKKNDEVYVIVLTNGENGNHTTNKEECFCSLKKLGIKI